MELARKIFRYVFTGPLRFVYMNGPKIFLLWEGLSDASICYELTSVDSTFWSSNDETVSACSEIIERKSNAFVIAVYVLIGAYCMYLFVSLLLYKYFFMTQISALLSEKIDSISINMRRELYQEDMERIEDDETR